MRGGRTRERIAPGVVPGEWWHALDDGRLECDLCPRTCKLREGQRGFCLVRQAGGGRILLTSYGRSSGFHVDPIEKKPLYHFHPGTTVLSFGTAGCNLGCRFCQNWGISKARSHDRLTAWAEPEDVAAAAVRSGCASVAFTYNEPVIFAEYAIDCAQAARTRGLRTVAVTAGSIQPRAREAFFAHIDAANVDLKAFTEEFYHRICLTSLAPVLDTLRWLRHHTPVWLEVTTLLIPGHNDSEAEVARLCDWFGQELGPEVPLHFSAFHPDHKMHDIARTPPSTLRRARLQAKAAGLRHVYTGNVRDPAGQFTACASCGHVLIEREGYHVVVSGLDRAGRCERCRAPLAGRFETL